MVTSSVQVDLPSMPTDSDSEVEEVSGPIKTPPEAFNEPISPPPLLETPQYYGGLSGGTGIAPVSVEDSEDEQEDDHPNKFLFFKPQE